GVRGLRIDAHRLTDEAFSLLNVPALVADEAESMQRIEISRRNVQHLPVNICRLRELPGTPQFERVLQKSIAHCEMVPGPKANPAGGNPRWLRSHMVSNAASRLRVIRAVSKSGCVLALAASLFLMDWSASG